MNCLANAMRYLALFIACITLSQCVVYTDPYCNPYRHYYTNYYGPVQVITGSDGVRYYRHPCGPLVPLF